MKTFLKLAVLLALLGPPIAAQPTIPASNISPVQQGAVLGRTSVNSGRAEQITAGPGITIANGLISASGGGGGAPFNATYITQTPNGTLTNEQPLSLLSTGLMFVTTATGAITSLGSTLPMANGGLAVALADPNADRILFWDDSAGAYAFLTAGSGLTITGTTITASGGAGTITANATLTANALVLGGGTTVVGVLGSLGTTTTVLHGNASGAPTFAAVNLANDVTGTLAVGFGGLGINTGTSGGVTYFSGTNTIASSGLLASGNIVVGGGTGAAPSTTGVSISGANNVTGINNATVSNFTVTNNMAIGNLSVTDLTVTANIVSTTVTDGQMFIGNGTGDRLQLATLTAGTGITITNAAGSITINSTASGGNITGNTTFTINGTTSASYDMPIASASIGYINIPQNSQSTAYTTLLADQGKHLLHPTADNNARTYTIDSNANVAYAVGTCITIVNQINTVTIAITSDTLTWYNGSGTATTGTRTLNSGGVATCMKVATTSWIIYGTGIN